MPSGCLPGDKALYGQSHLQLTIVVLALSGTPPRRASSLRLAVYGRKDAVGCPAGIGASNAKGVALSLDARPPVFKYTSGRANRPNTCPRLAAPMPRAVLNFTIQGCGFVRIRRVCRILRYALHFVPHYSGCLPSDFARALDPLSTAAPGLGQVQRTLSARCVALLPYYTSPMTDAKSAGVLTTAPETGRLLPGTGRPNQLTKPPRSVIVGRP